MVRDNPPCSVTDAHRPARAELSLALDAGILTFGSPHTGPAGGQLNGTNDGACCGGSIRCFWSSKGPAIAVNVTFTWTWPLSFIVPVLKTQGGATLFLFSFGKDVEPIHEWQHQES